MQFLCACVCSCVCVLMWVCVCACARVRMRTYVLASSSFLTSPFTSFSSSSLSRLLPLFVCVNFPLHHTPPFYSPLCFDPYHQGISCVRLMFFSRVLRFFHASPEMFELDFYSSFPRSDLSEGVLFIYAFSCIIYSSISSSFSLSSSLPP